MRPELPQTNTIIDAILLRNRGRQKLFVLNLV